MEFSDLNTRLPPRKRLLAGFKRESLFYEFLPPIPFISSDLGGRIRDAMNSPNSSPAEIVEVCESVALEAAELAVAARKKAVEKAAQAAKAKAAAKGALELLDSITRNRRPKKVILNKNKLRKKEMPIKLFYKNNHPAKRRETDEQLTQRLHHFMSSSPRISSNKGMNLENSGNRVISDSSTVCNKNSNGDKLEEKIALCSNADISEGEEDKTNNFRGKKQDSSKPGGIADSRRSKIGRKRLPLSLNRDEDHLESKSLPGSEDHSVDREPKKDCAERSLSLSNAKSSDDCERSAKITSIWKCKKLKMSQCSSDSKILPALC